MDRRIEVKVFGNHLWKDGNRAGVQGEGNVTTLRISFDEGWDEYAKSITFFDAKGRNPVKRVLTADLFENIANSTLVYLCKIPFEPLAEAGWCSFVIEGSLSDGRQRSVETKLEVLPAKDSSGANAPAEPTPSQAEQLQGEIEKVTGDLQAAVKATNAIMGMTVSAQSLGAYDRAKVEKSENEDGSIDLHFAIPRGEPGEPGPAGKDGTMTFEDLTPEQRESLRGPQGVQGPEGPQGPQGETGERGPQGIQGIQGERGISGVYVGSGTMPEGYNVQIDPNGEASDLPTGGGVSEEEVQAAVNAALQVAKDSGEFDGPKGDKGDKGDTGAQGPKGDTGATGPQGPAGSDGAKGDKGDKGETGAQGPKGDTGEQGPKGDKGDTGAQGPAGADGEKGDKGDKGDAGYTPVKGKDYWTAADKSEMVSDVVEAMPDSGDMKASIYDPAGLKKDIFLYIGEMARDAETNANAYTDEMIQESSGGGVLECYLDQTEFWEVNEAYQNGSTVVMWDNNELWPLVYANTDNEYKFRIVDPDGVRTATLTEEGWSNSYDAFSAGGSSYAIARIKWVELPASAWEGSGSLYSQVVEIDGVTENSQVDLTPSVEQLAVFYEKDLTFVTENEDGVVTVYAIGQKPTNDYTIQVTVTEVNV